MQSIWRIEGVPSAGKIGEGGMGNGMNDNVSVLIHTMLVLGGGREFT